MPGNLYICATPIGNLEDITYRVVRTLKEVDAIVAEDTRQTKKILLKFNIQTPLSNYHKYNIKKLTPKIIQLLKEGKNLALVSDAGTPGISDPGEELIKAAIDANIPVISLPGPTSVISALVVSGLRVAPFTFLGFLPKKKTEIKKILSAYLNTSNTLILFESPRRLIQTLGGIKDIFSDPFIAVARELTKLFEEVKRGKASEVMAYFKKGPVKGEIIIIIQLEGEKPAASQEQIEALIKACKKASLSHRDSAKVVAAFGRLPKNEAYKKFL